MEKKKVIIHISIFIASIFLLVHSVLPHAHHDGVICLMEEQIDCNDNAKDLHEGHGHHHHHGNVEDCDLKEYIVREVDTESNQLSFSIDLFSAYCFVHFLDHTCLGSSLLEQKLPSAFLYQIYISPFVSSTYGLRAPPVSSFLG